MSALRTIFASIERAEKYLVEEGFAPISSDRLLWISGDGLINAVVYPGAGRVIIEYAA